MLEIAKRSARKFKEFQSRRREQHERERQTPSNKNFFMLMEKLNNIDKYGVPTIFTVQNPDYFVQAGCLVHYKDFDGWVTDSALIVIQPTDIQGMEVLSEFSMHKNHSNPESSEILVATALIDNIFSQKYIQAASTTFKVIKRYADEDLREKKQKTVRQGELTESEHNKVIRNAYNLAYQAITRRSLPDGIEVVKPGIVQLHLQLNLA